MQNVNKANSWLKARVTVTVLSTKWGSRVLAWGTLKILIQLAENHHNSTNLKQESLQKYIYIYILKAAASDKRRLSAPCYSFSTIVNNAIITYIILEEKNRNI